MSGIVLVITVGVFVASLVAFAINVVVPGSDNTNTEDRLTMMAARRRQQRGAPQDQESGSLLLEGENEAGQLSKIVSNLPALRDYLEQADVRMKPAKFAFICIVCFSGGLAFSVVSPVPLLLAPVIGILTAGIPIGWLLLKRKRRLAKLGDQLPEALELLSRSLRAGHSLNAGFGLVASEMDGPLATEFGRAFEEQNFGIPLDEAIEDMARRIPNMDLRFFAMAVVLQRQTGGDLAEILDKIGRLVRERLQILGQIQALTGEGRMSGAVLLAMPPVLFLVMLKLNFEYVTMLFTDQIGRYMLCMGLVTQVLGAIMIKKIITIKV